MRNVLVLSLLILVVSCVRKETEKALRKEVGLDLEKASFAEDPLVILKDKIDSSRNATADFVKEGHSEPFDYPNGYKLDKWNGEKSLYGKAYHSRALDSIAHYKDLYLNHISYLTHENKTVALFATADVTSEKVYPQLIEHLNTEFGDPSFRTPTSVDEFYEWTGNMLP